MHIALTREEAIKVAEDLIKGTITTRQVWDWACELELPENDVIMQKLRDQDPDLVDFISTLAMSDLVGDAPNTKLYGVEDYKEWLREFNDTIQQKN